MPTDYEKLYQEQRHALGEPAKEFVRFFDQYKKRGASVLDIGCGQGRDALFIARQGHHIVGVDISETVIVQLLEDARSEGLSIEWIVADLRDFNPDKQFDIVLIDRTLHMLAPDPRLQLLQRLGRSVREGGYLLIADEKSNLPDMKKLLENDSSHWTILKHTRGFLFSFKSTHIDPDP